jgi:hypothetical protein
MQQARSACGFATENFYSKVPRVPSVEVQAFTITFADSLVGLQRVLLPTSNHDDSWWQLNRQRSGGRHAERACY